MPLFWLILALFLAGCSSAPTQPEEPGQTLWVDESQTWSPVGDSIAYHRTVASSDGPAGVYVVHVSGHGTRLVVADDGNPFTELQFSPDGTMLAGTRGGQLVLIALATGAVTEPLSAEFFAGSPDWSPDQSKLVLSRFSWSPGDSPDSTVLHVFDLATNLYRPLISPNPNPMLGKEPRWSPDGHMIAFVDERGLVLVNADGTNSRVIVGLEAGELLGTPRWIEGGRRILYEHFFDGTYTTWVTTVDGNVRGRWSSRLGDAKAISPDGQHIVVRSGKRDGKNLYVLLFQRSLYGPSDESLVPLTRYAP